LYQRKNLLFEQRGAAASQKVVGSGRVALKNSLMPCKFCQDKKD